MENYQILGLTPDATDEEITARYEELIAKYKEERWLDGEAGNNAARMLTKVQTAYKEIMSERKEKSENTEGVDAFAEIAELLKKNDLAKAQDMLDNFNERNAEWHYLQAVVYYKKNWANDCKKQLEIAMQMDPDNVKYRSAYGKMNAKNDYQQQSAHQQGQSRYAGNNGGYHGQGYNQNHNNPYDEGQNQMGGNICSDCLCCCYANLCANCLINSCCGQ